MGPIGGRDLVKHVGGALIPLLSLSRDETRALTRQLTEALRDMIRSGALPAGVRLPSSRTLARDQGVSRTTAISAYDQLAAEGLITAQVGSGSYVAEGATAPQGVAPAVDARPARLAQLAQSASEQFFPRLDHPQEPQAFVTGMPALDLFPMPLWSRLAAARARGARGGVMGYGDPCGLAALREAVRDHLGANRGVACAAEDVLIFNGAQHAFTFIAAALLDPGDVVWFENPGAIGARNALIASGARLAPVAVDAEGLDVAAAQRLAPEFRLAFVTPAHQHPTGVALSEPRRAALLAAAEAARGWIIEDDYVGEFHYGPHALPPLKARDQTGRVIYVGTFSKSLFPALRLGYAVAPPRLAETFRRLARAAEHGAPSHMQGVVADFIAEGHFAAHLRRMNAAYAERRAALLEAGGAALAGIARLRAAETGFHAIADLERLSETAAARAAQAAGLTISTLGAFALSPVSRRALLLGFSAIPPLTIRRGAAALGAALRSLG